MLIALQSIHATLQLCCMSHLCACMAMAAVKTQLRFFKVHSFCLRMKDSHFPIDLTHSILTHQSEGILLYTLILALWSSCVSIFGSTYVCVHVKYISHTVRCLVQGDPFLTFLNVFFSLPNTWGNLISLCMLNISTFSYR